MHPKSHLPKGHDSHDKGGDVTEAAKKAHNKGARTIDQLPPEIRECFRAVGTGEKGDRGFVRAQASKLFNTAQTQAESSGEPAMDILRTAADVENVQKGNEGNKRRADQFLQTLEIVTEMGCLPDAILEVVSEVMKGIRAFRDKISLPSNGTVLIPFEIDADIKDIIARAGDIAEEYSNLKREKKYRADKVAAHKIGTLCLEWSNEFDRGGTPQTGRKAKSRGMSRGKYVAKKAAEYLENHPEIGSQEKQELLTAIRHSEGKKGLAYYGRPYDPYVMKKEEEDKDNIRAVRMEAIEKEIQELFDPLKKTRGNFLQTLKDRIGKSGQEAA